MFIVHNTPFLGRHSPESRLKHKKFDIETLVLRRVPEHSEIAIFSHGTDGCVIVGKDGYGRICDRSIAAARRSYSSTDHHILEIPKTGSAVTLFESVYKQKDSKGRSVDVNYFGVMFERECEGEAFFDMVVSACENTDLLFGV